MLDELRAGRISAEVALARLALDGLSADEIAASLPEGSAIAALFERHRDGLDRVAGMLRAARIDHTGGSVDAIRSAFDRAVAVAPEASVAAYSLDDPGVLARATAELVQWLAGEGLIGPRAEVLDVGCGIGRVSAALAPLVGRVTGVDISGGMIDEAGRRHGALPNVRFQVAGATGPWPRADLALFVDSMPYLVQAGIADAGFAEAVRVAGSVAVLNLSYPEDAALAERWAGRFGLALAVSAPFRLWDATAYVWRRSR